MNVSRGGERGGDCPSARIQKPAPKAPVQHSAHGVQSTAVMQPAKKKKHCLGSRCYGKPSQCHHALGTGLKHSEKKMRCVDSDSISFSRQLKAAVK